MGCGRTETLWGWIVYSLYLSYNVGVYVAMKKSAVIIRRLEGERIPDSIRYQSSPLNAPKSVIAFPREQPIRPEGDLAEGTRKVLQGPGSFPAV